MTTRIRRAAGVLVAGAAVLGAVAGCADAPAVAPAGADHGTHTMPDGRAMPDEQMAGHAGHGGDGLALWATQKAGGTVMVIDGDGRPFYRSDADRPAPACAGPCAVEWEPVIADDRAPDLLGVQRADVGTVRRADGATQLTLGGAPLYRHAGDVADQPDPRRYADRGWFVVTPRGERVTG